MSLRVLLIDDDDALRAMMKSAFDRAGFETFTAADGEGGLDLFHQILPDLVVTDIVMPEREGMSVIIDIKKSLFSTNLIAISGGGEGGRTAYLRWAKELGADFVLRKPFRMSELLFLAHQALFPLGAGAYAAPPPAPNAPSPPIQNP